MRDTEFKPSNVEPKQNDYNLNKQDNKYKDLFQKYHHLHKENHNLINENNILRNLILEKKQENLQISSIEELNLLSPNKKLKIEKSFYIQILLGILVILASLGFHIVYLAVTSCLMYSDGDPGCWYQNWLGIDIHASFFIDLILYSLLVIQSVSIILIIRDKIIEKNRKLDLF